LLSPTQATAPDLNGWVSFPSAGYPGSSGHYSPDLQRFRIGNEDELDEDRWSDEERECMLENLAERLRLEDYRDPDSDDEASNVEVTTQGPNLPATDDDEEDPENAMVEWEVLSREELRQMLRRDLGNQQARRLWEFGKSTLLLTFCSHVFSYMYTYFRSEKT
jgi:hypothetical protein